MTKNLYGIVGNCTKEIIKKLENEGSITPPTVFFSNSLWDDYCVMVKYKWESSEVFPFYECTSSMFETVNNELLFSTGLEIGKYIASNSYSEKSTEEVEETISVLRREIMLECCEAARNRFFADCHQYMDQAISLINNIEDDVIDWLKHTHYSGMQEESIYLSYCKAYQWSDCSSDYSLDMIQNTVDSIIQQKLSTAFLGNDNLFFRAVWCLAYLSKSYDKYDTYSNKEEYYDIEDIVLYIRKKIEAIIDKEEIEEDE